MFTYKHWRLNFKGTYKKEENVIQNQIIRPSKASSAQSLDIISDDKQTDIKRQFPHSKYRFRYKNFSG